MHFVVGGVVR